MTSSHENSDQDKYADQDGLPRLGNRESGQNPDHHGENENKQEQTNQEVHDPISQPEPQTGAKECDHVVGFWAGGNGDVGALFLKSDGWEPIHQYDTSVFRFCPDCGTRLLPEGPNSTTPKES